MNKNLVAALEQTNLDLNAFANTKDKKDADEEESESGSEEESEGGDDEENTQLEESEKLDQK